MMLGLVRIVEVTVAHFRGWEASVTWRPAETAVLVGPNSGGKTSLLSAVNVVLDPYRDAYRSRLAEPDYFNLDTTSPVEITVTLTDLSADDLDHFESHVEGRRDDGTFGGWDSPQDEFDQGDLVLRLGFRAVFGEPARAFFRRPESAEAPVHQTDKVRIGWHYIAADLDPLHELAFYNNSVFSKLFERVDLSSELDNIRHAIDDAKGPLLAEPTVADTRRRLQEAAARLRLVDGHDALDFAVAGLSDRRVLQSLQPVLRGRRATEHLPLSSHGRGLLRVLLLTAILQQARLDEENLILAVEEPEQNLEPINQRLVIRSLLALDADADQLLISTHSPDVVGTVPLAAVHLVRDFAGGPDVRSLRGVAAPEHKFFERHARGPIVDGLYADAVLLTEGPTERAALPVLWADYRPGRGLDEERIELIDCESIDNMPPYVRFFRALGIPVAVVCDADRDDAYDKIKDEKPDLLVRWHTHRDWEGVLAAEGAVQAIAAALDACHTTVWVWAEHEHDFRNCVRSAAGDADHLAAANSIPALLADYDEAEQRAALAALLRGDSGFVFKSAIYARQIAQALPAIPETVVSMIELVHRFAAGDTQARGHHDL
jgi:putative ATP-dependent endonuclease of the OLD family